MGVPNPSQELGSVSSGDITALARLFQEFQTSTNALQEAYDRLQQRVAEIDAELEVKNAELESANQALQRKMAELDEVRQYLAHVLESMNSGVITIGTDGKITMLNPTASSWLQEEAGAIQGRPITDFFPTHFVPCVLNALSAGERFSEVEESLIAADGAERFIRTNAAPIFDGKGNRIGALMIFNDITQLRLLQEKARRQDRLAALGELAAGVAHEMRNPLTTIRGYIQILPTEISEPDFQQEFLSEVLKEIDRLTELTDNLLDLSKPVSASLQPHDMDRLIDDVVNQVSEQALERGVRFALQLQSDGARVLMDRNRMKQVLLNLILNAFDAVAQQGLVSISSGRRSGSATLDGSPCYFLTVTDNGRGMSGDVRARLFDPFFTTKEKGTGLGLSVSNRIVQEHGGLIQVVSEQEKGTTFTVLLPLYAGGTTADASNHYESILRGIQSR